VTSDLTRRVAAEGVGTAFLVMAVILALQPVSAAFNPVVTLVERVLGMVPTGVAVALVVAQVVGGIAGAVIANLMFDLEAVTIASTNRSGGGPWLGEVVATLGLVLVIFGALRSGRTNTVAFAVAGYITAAYWFTSSTSFAKPAVTVARMFSDTFTGIAPGSVPMFLAMQLIGGALALALVMVLYPAPDRHPHLVDTKETT
jgi:glycerol uptake facilitator-like aquaporin